MAYHADQALGCWTTGRDESRVLRYSVSANVAVLHHDETLLPKRKRAWASWNFRVPAGETGEVNITYYMNFCNQIGQTLCVTLNR